MVAKFHPQGFQKGREGRNNNQRGRSRGHNHNSGGSHYNSGSYVNPNQFQNFNSSNFNQGNLGLSSQFQTFNQAKQSNQNSGQSSRPICQICSKSGHSALDCYHRMDFTYQGRHPPAKLASMVANAAQVQASNAWLTDTGYSDHVTPNLS